MAKILLLGIVWFSAFVPLAFANSRSPKRALRNLQVLCVIGIVIWSHMALVWYPRYAPLWKQIP